MVITKKLVRLTIRVQRDIKNYLDKMYRILKKWGAQYLQHRYSSHGKDRDLFYCLFRKHCLL